MTYQMMLFLKLTRYFTSNELISLKQLRRKRERIEALIYDKTRLMLTISKLKEEVDHMNSKLEGMSKSIRMLNSGTDDLEKILGMGKSSKYMKGFGYTGEP